MFSQPHGTSVVNSNSNFGDGGILQMTPFRMKSGRKLKDYPPIPSTPPPAEKKDRGLAHLEDELDQEKKYLSALCIENKELEEILQNLDNEISYIKSNFPDKIAGDGKVHADNDLWFKYESQIELNRKLERERKHLLNDIRQIEEQGMINLDSLTQSELILYVKQLERTKTDLLSDLRSKEWGLDKQAKDIHHLNEMKKALQAEIRHYDKEFALFRHYKKTSCPSASPTGSRPSSIGDEKRLKLLKEKGGGRGVEQAEVIADKRSSLSQENVAGELKTDVMFSSLDESKLEGMECESPAGFRRRSMKGGLSKKDSKKTGTKKTVAIAPLPELTKSKSKTPSPRTSRTTTTKRTKPENKVGRDSPKPGKETSNKPIKIIVTYETQTTTVTEKVSPQQQEGKEKSSGEKSQLESSHSIEEEIYEDDFEDSDVEKYQDTNIGFLTTRVKKRKPVRLKPDCSGSKEAEEEPETEVQRVDGKSEGLMVEPAVGKQIVITVRIFLRVLPDGRHFVTVQEEAF